MSRKWKWTGACLLGLATAGLFGTGSMTATAAERIPVKTAIQTTDANVELTRWRYRPRVRAYRGYYAPRYYRPRYYSYGYYAPRYSYRYSYPSYGYSYSYPSYGYSYSYPSYGYSYSYPSFGFSFGYSPYGYYY